MGRVQFLSGFFNASSMPVCVVDQDDSSKSRFFEPLEEDPHFHADLPYYNNKPLVIHTKAGVHFIGYVNEANSSGHTIGIRITREYNDKIDTFFNDDMASYFANINDKGEIFLNNKKLEGELYLRIKELKCIRQTNSMSDAAATAAVTAIMICGGTIVGNTKIGNYAGGLPANLGVGFSGQPADDLVRMLHFSLNAKINKHIRDDVYMKVNGVTLSGKPEDYYLLGEGDTLTHDNYPFNAFKDIPLGKGVLFEVFEWDRGGEYFHDRIGAYNFTPAHFGKTSDIVLTGDAGGIYTLKYDIVFK